MIEVRVLGPVEIRIGGSTLEVRRPQQNAVLAALAVDAGQLVPVEVLVDRVWGTAPAQHARRALQAHIARIRRQLVDGDAPTGNHQVRLSSRSGGYALEIEPDRVDLHRFRRLVERARRPRPADPQPVVLLREALSLWRGQPLAGLPGDWAARMRRLWEHQRLDAVTAWAQAELEVGTPETVIGPLADLVAEHPLVEPLTATLMRALYAAGRSPEALELYATARGRLVEELGIEPGAELQTLHRAILRGELDSPVPRSTPPPGPRAPALLPPDVHGFAGRHTELARLSQLLTNAQDRSTAVVISALSGTAGVGKTALAVHWAHQIAGRFTDGQLYINLRGFDPTSQPLEPAEAARALLDALDVPPQRIPASDDAQLGLYRSTLAGKRMLVVLDNARDAAQIRPLLPGSPGCLVVVTSRNQLSSLVATEGAYLLTLDLLPDSEARDLLALRLGADRVSAEPQAVQEIITRCARLPLALALAAAHAAARPRFGLAALADQLGQARSGLDVLDAGDPATDLRAVFSWSYDTLSPDAARLFRLLAVHPGPDVSVAAAASLAGTSAESAQRLLAELTRACLVSEHAPGRYILHDLLSAYATELANAVEPVAECQGALRRLLDHYLHTAYAADRLLNPQRQAIDPTAGSGVATVDIADYPAAMAWFTAEHPVLLAAVERAAAGGFDVHAWQLAWTLASFLDRRGHLRSQSLAATHRTAVDAARRCGDRPAQAHASRTLARAYARLGHLEDAHTHLRHAMDLFDQLGDHNGRADTHRNLAYVFERQHRHREALDHVRQALHLYGIAGNHTGQARTLNAVGWYLALLGEHQQALGYCQRALPLLRAYGLRQSEAATWDSLGYAYHHLTRYDEAASSYQQALGLYRQLDDRYYEARTLTNLGDTHHAAGDHDAARETWQRARDILDELDHPDANQVRGKLQTLGHPTRATDVE